MPNWMKTLSQVISLLFRSQYLRRTHEVRTLTLFAFVEIKFELYAKKFIFSLVIETHDTCDQLINYADYLMADIVQPRPIRNRSRSFPGTGKKLFLIMIYEESRPDNDLNIISSYFAKPCDRGKRYGQ